MSNFIDLSQLQQLLPQPDVTLEPEPTPTVSTAPEPTTQPPQTMPPPDTIPPQQQTQAPLPPIIVNVPEPREDRKRNWYPRSPYWQGYGYGGQGLYPVIGQTQGIGSDNSIKTGDITTTWQHGNVTQENVQQQQATLTPQTPVMIPTPPPPPPPKGSDGLSMRTKIVLGLCAAALVGVLGYFAYKKFMSKKKANNKRNINNNNNANNNLFDSLNNALNNTGNNNRLPRPPQS